MQMFFVYVFICVFFTSLMTYNCDLCTINDVMEDSIYIYIILAISMLLIYF